MAEMTIKRFGVFSVGKMQSLVMGVIGLILGVIYGLLFMVVGAAVSLGGSSDRPNPGGLPSIVIGIVFMITIPLLYTFLGFIVGCIWALVYNLASGVVGGIKFELEGAGPGYIAPPAPQQWSPQQYPAQ